MRAIFSIVSLLAVLVVVGMLAKKQLQATGQVVGTAAPTAGASGTVAERSRQVQQQIKSDVGKLLEQGAQDRLRDEAGQ